MADSPLNQSKMSAGSPLNQSKLADHKPDVKLLQAQLQHETAATGVMNEQKPQQHQLGGAALQPQQTNDHLPIDMVEKKDEVVPTGGTNLAEFLTITRP